MPSANERLIIYSRGFSRKLDISEVKIATGTARLTCNVTGHMGGIPILPSRTASAHVLDGKEAIFPFGLNVWQGRWITTSIVGYLRCVTVIYCYV